MCVTTLGAKSTGALPCKHYPVRNILDGNPNHSLKSFTVNYRNLPP